MKKMEEKQVNRNKLVQKFNIVFLILMKYWLLIMKSKYLILFAFIKNFINFNIKNFLPNYNFYSARDFTIYDIFQN